MRSFAGKVIAIAALVSGGWALDSARPAEARADTLISAPLGEFVAECTHQCRTCGFEKHDIVVGVENKYGSSHLENCNAGSCDSHTCNATLASVMGDLWVELQQTSGESMKELLKLHADVATYNPQRKAIQFRCDQGNLVASLPLTERQAVALE